MYPYPGYFGFGGGRPGFGRQNPYGPTFEPTRLPGRGAGIAAPSAPNASVGGNSTIVQPGEPHFCEIRCNRAEGRLKFMVCRCRNPNSHGDAITFHDEDYVQDLTGNTISWIACMNKILDIHGKNSMSREEMLEKCPLVVPQHRVVSFFRHARKQDWQVAAGVDFINCDNLQFHNEDGHARAMLTEEGLKTRVQRPDYYSNDAGQQGGRPTPENPGFGGQGGFNDPRLQHQYLRTQRGPPGSGGDIGFDPNVNPFSRKLQQLYDYYGYPGFR